MRPSWTSNRQPQLSFSPFRPFGSFTFPINQPQTNFLQGVRLARLIIWVQTVHAHMGVQGYTGRRVDAFPALFAAYACSHQSAYPHPLKMDWGKGGDPWNSVCGSIWSWGPHPPPGISAFNFEVPQLSALLPACWGRVPLLKYTEKKWVLKDLLK